MKAINRIITQTNLVLLGLIIFGIGVYLTRGLLPFGLNPVDDAALNHWGSIALIRDLGAILVVTTVIISGIGSIKRGGPARWRKVALFLGYLIGAIFLVLHGIAYVQMGKILPSNDFTNMIVKIENLLRSENTPESRRPLLLRKLAESRYLQYGERIEIIDHDNQQQIYQPPKEIIKFKQQNDRSRKLFGWIKKKARNSIFIWAGVLLLSSAIGFFAPFDKSRL
jgi:hypothetical protein